MGGQAPQLTFQMTLKVIKQAANLYLRRKSKSEKNKSQVAHCLEELGYHWLLANTIHFLVLDLTSLKSTRPVYSINKDWSLFTFIGGGGGEDFGSVTIKFT